MTDKEREEIDNINATIKTMLKSLRLLNQADENLLKLLMVLNEEVEELNRITIKAN